MVLRRKPVSLCITAALAIVVSAGCGGSSGSSSLPSPSSTQQPKPGSNAPPGVTPGVKIYATNFSNSINVYDEQGFAIASCPFPNLNGPWQIAYDSHNKRLYVTNTTALPAITVYDLNGNAVTLPGPFTGALRTIAFDSNNNHLYTLAASGQTPGKQFAVFDENGNSVPISGTFPNATSAFAMAFDPFNHYLYVVNQTTSPEVAVYDEQGHQVPMKPSFKDCGLDQGIVFDPHTRHFYLMSSAESCSLPGITILDESLHQVPVTGAVQFFNFAGFAETFDPHNNQLYVQDAQQFIIDVWTINGTTIGVGGSPGAFPNLNGNFMLTAP